MWQGVFRNCCKQTGLGISVFMISGIAVRRCFWKTVFLWNRFKSGLVIAIFQPQPIFMHIWIAVPNWFRLMQCWMVWEWILNKKASSWKSTTDLFLRRRWDSNPRTLTDQTISSRSRYDHFDTSPHLSQHQNLGKRRELRERTAKNIKLIIP